MESLRESKKPSYKIHAFNSLYPERDRFSTRVSGILDPGYAQCRFADALVAAKGGGFSTGVPVKSQRKVSLAVGLWYGALLAVTLVVKWCGNGE